MSSSLRNKITIPFALLTLVIAAAGTLLTVRLTSGSLEERLSNYVVDAVSVAGEGMGEHERTLLAALRAMAYTEGVAPALASDNGDELAQLLIPLKMNYRLDTVEVVDSSGREVLGIRQQPDSSRVEDFQLTRQEDLSSWPIVERILGGQVDDRGDKHAAILTGPSGALLLVGGPVTGGGGVTGAVLVGTYLDNLAEELAARAVARVSIYGTAGDMLSSTLFAEGQSSSLTQDQISVLEGDSKRAVLTPILHNGREYLAGYAPLSIRSERIAVLSAAVPTEHIAQANASARTLMVLLFSIAGLGVLMMGYFIAGRITAPIATLVAFSRRVAGYDFSQRIKQVSSDEVGELSSAFNFMAGELERHTDELQQRIADLAFLCRTSTDLNRSQGMAEVLEVAVDSLHRSGEVSAVLLLLRDDTSARWYWAAARGLPYGQDELLSRSLDDPPPSLLSVAQGSGPLLVEQGAEIAALKSDIGVDFPVSSMMLIPLASNERVVGVIVLGRIGSTAFQNDTQVVLLHTLSTEISWSIQRAQLHAQVTEQVNQLITLQQVSRSISAKLSRDEVLQQILRDVAGIAHADMTVIALRDPLTGQLQLAAHADGLVDGDITRWPERELAEASARAGRPFTRGNGRLAAVSADDEQVELGDAVSVPVQAEGQVLGSIVVRVETSGRPFLRSDLMVLSTVANQAGVALKNALLYEDIKTLYHNVVKSLAAAIDARDPYTHGHSHRVAANSVLLAEALGLPPKYLEAIEVAAYLHDVGKIGVRDNVLLKTGTLSDEERVSMKEHSAVGARILQPVGFDQQILSIVLSHHERFDGNGYPSGLKGEEIPLGGRILCVADSFDAMVSSRPYRSGLPIQTALDEIRKNAGTQFDPDVAREFIALVQKGLASLPGQPSS